MVDKIKWMRYFQNTDFSKYEDILSGFITDEIVTIEQGQRLADVLNEIDLGEGKGQWVSDSSSDEWNLAGAKVILSGANNPSLPTRGSYLRVLSLEFPVESIGPQYRIYMQYKRRTA